MTKRKNKIQLTWCDKVALLLSMSYLHNIPTTLHVTIFTHIINRQQKPIKWPFIQDEPLSDKTFIHSLWLLCIFLAQLLSLVIFLYNLNPSFNPSLF